MPRINQLSLSGGEVSNTVSVRVDVAKRSASLRRARNTLGLPQGGQYSRAGFEFSDLVPVVEGGDNDKARLVRFVFSRDQAYSLEFSDKKMRVYFRGGLVTKPRITITAISKEVEAVITVPKHGYTEGQTLTFSGVEGMVEINGLRGKVIEVIDEDNVRIDLDTSEFSTFTGDTGGVAGDAEGGTGGEPEPPPPGEEPPPAPVPDDPIPPPPPPIRPPYGIDEIYLEP